MRRSTIRRSKSPQKIFGCEKIKTATVNAIRVVIGMHASPPSHCTNKVACDAAKPTVRRRTFKTYKAKLYGAE